MATVLEKIRPGEVGQLDKGVKLRPIPLEILGMEKAMQARYDLLGDLKSGFGLLLEKKGKFWFYQHGCLYYKNSTSIFEIHGDIYKKWVALGKDAFGIPDTNEMPCVDGTGRFNHFENGTKTIFWHPSTGANAVWGDIKVRWNELGWERSYLGYPTSDEVDFPDGGRVNAFQNGGIYWWPDTGAMDVRDVVVHYTGLVCIRETGEISGADEPYVVLGTVSPFSHGAYQSATYSSVDSNTSRADLMEIYRGKPNGLAIAVRLMEHDHGNRNKITQDLAAAMTQVHKVGTEALKFIPVVGSGIAAIAGPVIQSFIPGIADAVDRVLGLGDDEIGRQTIVLTGKDMLLMTRRNNNPPQMGINFKFSTNNLKGQNANYKVYFTLGPI